MLQRPREAAERARRSQRVRTLSQQVRPGAGVRGPPGWKAPLRACHEGREARPSNCAAGRGNAGWGPRFPRAQRAEPRSTWRAGAGGGRVVAAGTRTRAGRGRPGSWA